MEIALKVLKAGSGVSPSNEVRLTSTDVNTLSWPSTFAGNNS
jgi:hypothetical protein